MVEQVEELSAKSNLGPSQRGIVVYFMMVMSVLK